MAARQIIEDLDYDATDQYLDQYDHQLEDIMNDFLATQGKWRIKWRKIPRARLARIWLDYGKSHVVRDTKGMADIADQMVRLIARLDVANALSGHDSHDPADSYELSEEEKERLLSGLEDEHGHWFVSDFGLSHLQKIAAQIIRAKTAEEQLHAVDRALNVVHQRSDLASKFIEGGSDTLRKIANQGGYETPDMPDYGGGRNRWLAAGGVLPRNELQSK